MVVALLLPRVDAVGLGRVEEGARRIGRADEAAAAHEHDRMVTGFVRVATAGQQAAGDIGEPHTAVVE
jgi:hypothetical protein